MTDAERQMQAKDVGAVVVTQDSTVCGIITDRDIVLRTVAEGKDAGACTGCRQQVRRARWPRSRLCRQSRELLRRCALLGLPALSGLAFVGAQQPGEHQRPSER